MSPRPLLCLQSRSRSRNLVRYLAAVGLRAHVVRMTGAGTDDRCAPGVADVVIVGGGPAGMMCGYLLARAELRVTVLEKHADFFRDFRGDTVHPSTMEILGELGLLDRFLARPHNRIDTATLRWFGQELKIGDLSHLPVRAPFIAMMPQWDFLDFLFDEASQLPSFALRRNADATGFVETNNRVTGVRLADGELVPARRLVIAADGRGSIARAVLPLQDLGSSIDVLWFRLPRDPSSEPGLRGVVEPGRVLVCIDRDDYWQCAMVVAKGAAESLRARGIALLRAEVEAAAPELGPLDAVLADWESVKLLSVGLDRLARWSRPGLLAIGDAAHTMSPIGGIGINLAIQDAVATANLLAAALVTGADVDPLLDRVRARRSLPTRLVQGAQKLAQDRLLARLISPDSAARRPPLLLRLLDRYPLLRRIPGRMIGLGFRREHVRSRHV